MKLYLSQMFKGNFKKIDLKQLLKIASKITTTANISNNRRMT